jgi:flagellum-specific ATP synthase
VSTVVSGWRHEVEGFQPVRWVGRVRRITGSVLESEGPPCRVGDVVDVIQPDGLVQALVIGVRDGRVQALALTDEPRPVPEARVVATPEGLRVPVGEGLLGRVLGPLGNPLDGRELPSGLESVALDAKAPPALERQPLHRPYHSGVAAIDCLLPMAYGQRVGIFAGSGVGKSTLLGMIARHNPGMLCVIGLIGERGREVREFLEDDLGDALARSVVVVATSDQPAPARMLGTEYATAVAEWFRAKGHDVVLILDSLTRYAMALREVGLAAGEISAARGYPPSVFGAIPRLLERSGASREGTITAFYTVLVEGDDLTEPITDTARATLDGHIVLSRALADQGHYPAIDPAASVSRLTRRVASPDQLTLMQRFRELWSVHESNRDLLRMGAYAPGSDPALDEALRRWDGIRALLRQGQEATGPADPVAALREVLA